MSQPPKEDSSDDENMHYLMATGIFPGFQSTITFKAPPGSKLGKRSNLDRDFDGAARRLHGDYFSATPKCSERQFERRFRMPRGVFQRLADGIIRDSIFVHRVNKIYGKGIHLLVRITAALRMLAYGSAADSFDEYLQMSEDSVLLSLKRFCHTVIATFGDEYLRQPTEDDMRRILEINDARGFPGCLGSIDCQHWEWKNCPIAWAGQFKGKEKHPTIVLEAICDAELWIWHAFFGSPGSLNDINVLDHSPTVDKIVAGEFPPSFPYIINGTKRTLPYYMSDGIYPDWALFLKTIQEALSNKENAFAGAQEAFRKDIERAFGVLLARFHILQRPARLWSRRDIAAVIKACIIIHNMIVEHRRDSYACNMDSLRVFEEARMMFADGATFEWQSHASLSETRENVVTGMWAAMVGSREARITSAVDHFSLKHDVIEHIWQRSGNMYDCVFT